MLSSILANINILTQISNVDKLMRVTYQLFALASVFKSPRKLNISFNYKNKMMVGGGKSMHIFCRSEKYS